MFVYLITNTINGKKYIGQTRRSLTVRWNQHKNLNNTNSCPYLYNAISKYGSENFSIEPLIIVHTKEDLDFYESFLIKEFDLRNPEKGYNLTDGGGGMPGFKMSEESKTKISVALKGKKNALGVKRSEETKKLLSEVHLGKVFSEEHRRNLSEAKKGHKMSEKDRAHLSEIMKGNKHSLGVKPSLETRLKIGAASKGNKHLLGHVHSEETRKKMVESRKRYLEQRKIGV